MSVEFPYYCYPMGTEFKKHVVIVGRPNVGKSRLFNRLVGRRLSIVHDQPGVTRDVVAAEVDDHFVLMDTGGLGMEPNMSNKEIVMATEEQVFVSLQIANLILFVVDGTAGLQAYDRDLANRFRKSGKTIFLVVNKVDSPDEKAPATDFYTFGFKKTFLISAEHALGTDELLTEIKTFVGPAPEITSASEFEKKRVKICFAGCPNVGKSSLTNSILGESRMIVSDMPGTTRDSVGKDFDFTNSHGDVWPFKLIDTAGLRYDRKVDTSLEYFSTVKTRHAMENADVVFMVLDARLGVTRQDKRIAGEIHAMGRPIAVIVNKWDYAQEAFMKGEIRGGYTKIEEFRDAFAEAALKELYYLPNCPVIFASAKTGYSIDRLLREARALHRLQYTQIKTAKVNKVIGTLVERNKPHMVGVKRFKIYYALQVGFNPIAIRVFCNQADRLDESYKRYIINNFSQTFELGGCPLHFEFIEKAPREHFEKESRD